MARDQKAKLRVYSIDYCPYCLAAKDLLNRLEIDYELTDLSGVPNRREVTSEILPGHATAPLIVIDDDPIGGYTELEALQASGELERRVFAD